MTRPQRNVRRALGAAAALGAIVGAAALFLAAQPDGATAAPGGAAKAPRAGSPAAQPLGAPTAQAFPTPNVFVSNLDVECWDTPGPSRDRVVSLTHLNPVLLAAGLPKHEVRMGELVETCVPVMKNNFVPANGSLPFVSHVDFACYKLEATALAAPVPLTLRHLNKAISFYPAHSVRLTRPDTLCVPVKKNGVAPPAEPLQLIEYLDLECWDLEQDPHAQMTLQIDHLNPQLIPLLPKHPLTLLPLGRKLCVPVQKDDYPIPSAALAILRWVDLERFVADPFLQPPYRMFVEHLNPVFAELPKEEVTLERAHALMVPVSKNGATPPSQ